jgi:hypothetical protein
LFKKDLPCCRNHSSGLQRGFKQFPDKLPDAGGQRFILA